LIGHGQAVARFARTRESGRGSPVSKGRAAVNLTSQRRIKMNKTQLMIAKFEHEKWGDACIYVLKGTCARVVDGNLQAKK
jgi:hypothetical protein